MKRKKYLLILLIVFIYTFECSSINAFCEKEDIFVEFGKEGAMLPNNFGGNWEIKKREPVSYCDYSFDDGVESFDEIYGEWSIQNGKYVQNGLSLGAAARALLPDNFSDFVMEFDVTPLSDDTKLMLFFGCTSLYNVCVAEITKDGSNLVLGETEIPGESGHIEKNKTYHVKFISENKDLILYLNDEMILNKTNIDFPKGQIGIGCWNSKGEFDNFKVDAPDAMGNGKKLIQDTKELSVSFLENCSEYEYFSSKIATDSFIDSQIGLIIGADENKNGYYLGIDGNSAFIKSRVNGSFKTIAQKDFKAYSKNYYILSARILKDKLIFSINSDEVLSVNIKDKLSDNNGIFSLNTNICAEYMLCSSDINTYTDNAEADMSKRNFSDISDEYYEAVSLLNALGIIGGYSDNTFRGNTFMTRGEFSDIIFRIQNIVPQSENFSFTLDDVSDDHIYKNALYSAIKFGYLKSDTSSAHPNDAISAEDAAYAFIKVLGYDLLEYEKNTLKNANDFGLLSSVKITNGALTRYNAAQMAFNTLTAKRYYPAPTTDSSALFKKNGSLLYDIFGVTKVKGTINATKYINAFSSAETVLGNNEIIFNGEVIHSSVNSDEYIGILSDCYIKTNIYDDNDLIAIIPCKHTKTVIRSNMLSDNCDTQNMRYQMFENSSKELNIKLDDNTMIVYNGQYYSKASEATDDIFNISNGTITVIDNYSTTSCDYVFIEDNIIYVVDTVSVPNNLIYDKYLNPPLSCDPIKDKFVIIKNNREISVKDIKEYDVLNVRLPKNTSGYTKIYVSSAAPVTGVVAKLTSDGLIIGTNEYNYSNITLNTTVKNSDHVTIYFDIYNKIAYIKKSFDYDYGYLIKTTYDTSEDENIYLKMFTFNNGKGLYPLAEKVSVFNNGSTLKYSKSKTRENSFYALNILLNDLIDSSAAYNSNGSLERSGILIKYKTNKDQQISEIHFPKNNTKIDIPDKNDDFSCYYDSLSAGETAYYYQGLINSKYRITQNTKILSLSGDSTDIDGFSKISSSSLSWDKYYSSQIFDVNEEFEAKVLVIKNMDLGYDQPVGIITQVTNELDEMGNSCIKIDMYKNGELISEKAENHELECDANQAFWFKNEGVRIKDLKQGDIIIYNKDSDGYINWFSVIFKNKEQDFYATSPRGWYWGTIPSTDMTLTYTPITKKVGNIFVFSSNNYSRPITNTQNAKYYICHSSSKKLEKASFDDVKSGDKVTMIWKTANLNTVVIYR